MKTKKCEYSVDGMHCASCEMLIENTAKKVAGVENVKANLNENKVTLTVDSDVNGQNIIKDINILLKKSGHKIITEKGNLPEKDKETKLNDVTKAFAISIVIVSLFYLLTKIGLAEKINITEMNYVAVFLIGVVASLSSCMIVVGSIVLSISSSYSKANEKVIPLTFFHVSRLVSFFILGGLIGLLGSVFTMTPMVYLFFAVIIFFVMIVLGVNLLDIFPFMRRFQFHMPKILTTKIVGIEKVSNILIPVLIGAMTFFLPCGFTQSMQITAIGTGSFMDGALTMFVFALGTFPALGLISFTSAKLSEIKQFGLFFKTAGFIIIYLAIFNFITALMANGIIKL